MEVGRCAVLGAVFSSSTVPERPVPTPGVAVRPYEPAAVAGVEGHLEAVRSVMRRSRGGCVVSHRSAALLHGLPLVCPVPGRVEQIVPRSSGGVRTSVRHARPLPLAEGERTEVAGVAVTTVARTLVDLAACSPVWAAVPAVDAARAAGRVRVEELHAVAAEHPTLVGLRRALHAVWVSIDRSQGPAESLSRLVLRHSGEVPPPGFGVPAEGFDDEPLGRLAFRWGRQRVVAIVDETPDDVIDPGRSLMAAELGELGDRVLRWGWDEVEHPHRLVRLVREAVDLRHPDRTPWY